MLPTVGGVIDRRILVNYRIDPSALGAVLPDPFEPRTVDGHAVGGVCLIRLTGMGPAGLPGGLSSENAAHRFAVEWDEGDERGVYVPRRDTSSRLNAALGGRLFAGRYHRAAFDVREDGDRFEVAVESRDGTVEVRVAATRADSLPDDSVFDSLEAASTFFERASLGYSPDGSGDFEGIELRTDEWSVTPLSVEDARASYLEDGDRFPGESVDLDCALLMTDVGHEWRRGESLCAPA